MDEMVVATASVVETVNGTGQGRAVVAEMIAWR